MDRPSTPARSTRSRAAANGPGNFGWVSWDGSNNAGSLATSSAHRTIRRSRCRYQFTGDPGKTNADDVRACLQHWVEQPADDPHPDRLRAERPGAPAGCSTGSPGQQLHLLHQERRRRSRSRVRAAGGRPDPGSLRLDDLVLDRARQVPQGITAPPKRRPDERAGPRPVVRRPGTADTHRGRGFVPRPHRIRRIPVS